MKRDRIYGVVVCPKKGDIKRVLETSDEDEAIAYAKEQAKDENMQSVVVSEFELHYVGFVWDSRTHKV